MSNAVPIADLAENQRVVLLHTLRKGYLFGGIALTVVQRLLMGCYRVRLPKGSYLFHDGQQAAGFYVVHSGSINVHRVTEGGKEQVIRVFYPGESFGEVVLAGRQAYPASAKGSENSQLIMVPTLFFRQQIQQDPDLALAILASMSEHLRFLVTTVEDLKLKQAETRVAQWLARQLELDGSTGAGSVRFSLPLAKHLLASQLGVSSETLSRSLAALRHRHLIDLDGKLVTVHNPEDLRSFILNSAADAAG
jgi:CRP/FNR family transcriptional regulator, dissimilatory nitrate respiration regulator